MPKDGRLSRRVHKLIGILLLLPMLVWSITGFIFFLKPGYARAYEPIDIKRYPLGELPEIAPNEDRTELRWIRSILGLHALQTSNTGTVQIHPQSGEPREQPDQEQIKRLLEDALGAKDADVWGKIAEITGSEAVTDTGIHLKLDWQRMSIYQSGPDTDRINFYYDLHYLRWTGRKTIDQILGSLGLVLVMLAALSGARLLWLSRR